MTSKAQGTFEMRSWDEKTWDGEEWDARTGAKLTRAVVSNVFQGDIQGESELQYLMVYNADETGTFIGFERITGNIGGRVGTFVLEHRGTFGAEGIVAQLTVAAGSATGDLAGLQGTGSFLAKHGTHATPFTLEYRFDEPA